MWWARSESVDVYLSGGVAAIRRRGVDTLVESLAARSRDDLLAEWAATVPRAYWRVWLGGSLCRLKRVDAVLGVRTIEEAEAVIGRLASDSGQAMEARLALWSRKRPWVACCSPAGFVESLMSLADKHRINLQSIRPWWSSVSTDRASGVACCDNESISAWSTDKKARVLRCSTSLVEEGRQAQALRRMRVAEPLRAYRLDLQSPVATGKAGFSVTSLDEDADAAAS
ncbi:hypothetical protein ACG04R_18900 [Roseateles sp. BYS78W]|uniref:Uncharacterized protein n=1 Tax=Pelomonas candidula TaxID=3299025 RepID=A0ABW7HGC3_9BURK